MEQMFASGDFVTLASMDAKPKAEKWNAHQKAVYEAWQKLTAKIADKIAAKVGVGEPVPPLQQQAQQAAGDALKSAPKTPPDANKDASTVKGEAIKAAIDNSKDVIGSIQKLNPNLVYGQDVVDASKWTKQSGALGSNPGGAYIDADGKKWYVKESKSNAHALNEVLSAKLYEAAGAAVLPYKLAYLGPDKFGTATPWMKNEGNIDLSSDTDKQAAHQDFAVHAWLANWDAMGTDNTNLAWVKWPDSIKMTAMDVGGSLIYRAQGGEKGNKFTNVANEWDSMRNPNVAKNCGPVFKNMTPQELVDSAKKVASVPDEVIEKLVDKYSSYKKPTTDNLLHKIFLRKNDIIKRANDIESSLM